MAQPFPSGRFFRNMDALTLAPFFQEEAPLPYKPEQHQ